MKVLIAGAAGYLGEHIVNAAVEAGHEVTALVRSSPAPFVPGVSTVEGDLNDGSLLARSLAAVDGVIFSAGRNWQPGLAANEYATQNISIVETFFATLAEANPKARIVFTSSMSAIGGSEQPVVLTEASGRENIASDRLNSYDRAKIGCEKLARAARDAGRDIVILNPGLMLGPGASRDSRMTTTFLVHWFCLKKNPVIVGSGGHSFCDVRDVARAHVAALKQGSGQYILGGENLTALEIQQSMSLQTGLGTPLQVPASIPYVAMATMDAISAATLGLWRNPIHREFARSLPLYYWGDSARASREIGYRTRPLAQTIRDTIADFVDRGMLPEDFRYVAAINEENCAAMLLLRELAQQHLHRSYLMPRLPRVLAACQQNSYLNASLDRALAAGKYDPGRGRFRWTAAAPAAALSKLRSLLDYCYYASDEFRERVM